MNERPLISIIVPAYNEEKRIGKTLEAISEYFQSRADSYEIVVVDDGSHDETKSVVENMALPNLRLVSYDANRGKGYAVNFGVKAAQGKWILFTDADNSTPIAEFDRLWRWTDSHQVIIGSRYLKGSHIAIRQGLPRILLGRLGNLLVQTLILPGVHDSQCGFKLFSRQAAEVIFALQIVWRWGFDMEILRIAKERGYRIKEVAITWLNDEQSKIQSSRVFAKTFLELLAIKKNSLLGRYGQGRSTAELFWRFAAVGAVGTVLDFAVLNVTHLSFGVELKWALTLGFLSGAVNNYLMNSLWTFEQDLSYQRLGKFLAVAVIGLALNNGIVLLLADNFSWNYNLAKLVALFVVFGWNFLANKRWTFD